MSIEIQIIRNKTTPTSWFKQAYDSVAKQLPESQIKVYEYSALGILHQRLHFIEQCKSSFLGWVEDTDFILPNTLNKCQMFLEGEQNKRYCGIFTALGLLPETKVFSSLADVVINCSGSTYSQSSHLSGETLPNPFMLFRTSALKSIVTIPTKFYAARAYSTDLITGYALLYGPWRKLLEPLYIKRNVLSTLDFETSEDIKKLIYDHLNTVLTSKNSKINPIKID